MANIKTTAAGTFGPDVSLDIAPKAEKTVTEVKSNKGATAILVGLLAFTAYLYLSGKLTAIGRAIGGQSDPIGTGTGTGGANSPLQVEPIQGVPHTVPINMPSPIPSPGIQIRPERFSFSVKHKQTGKSVTIHAVTGFGCTQTVSTLLVAGAGYSFQEAVTLADRICADATNRSVAKQQAGRGSSTEQFAVVP